MMKAPLSTETRLVCHTQLLTAISLCSFIAVQDCQWINIILQIFWGVTVWLIQFGRVKAICRCRYKTISYGIAVETVFVHRVLMQFLPAAYWRRLFACASKQNNTIY